MTDGQLSEALDRLARGDLSGAEAGCRRVLAHRTDDEGALHVLGMVYERSGRRQEALDVLESLAARYPGSFSVHNTLGNVLQNAGRQQDAATSFRRALAIRPDFFPAHLNLGNVLQDEDRIEEALSSYRRALALSPQSAVAHNNCGNALIKSGAVGAGVAEFACALEIDPNYLDARFNLSSALSRSGRFVEAEREARRAIALCRTSAEAHCSLGIALSGQGFAVDAEACFRTALRLRPEYPDALFNLGLKMLSDGRFRDGWQAYEARFAARACAHPPIPAGARRWDGTRGRGKTIIVLAEQGRGDAMHFARFGSVMRAAGIPVILQCDPSLVRILGSGNCFDEVQPYGAPPAGRVCEWIPLLSLPHVYQAEPSTWPARAPYLRASPGLIEAWSASLRDTAGLRIGIAWQGNREVEKCDLYGRSIPVRHFAEFADMPGVTLVPLQKGATTEELEQLGSRKLDFTGSLDQGTDAFVDTAALMMNLDLVITSDTSIAHLAGALGRPVWVGLHTTPSFQWLREREDSPWYPTMRLFRQATAGDWATVFRSMRAALENFRAS